MLQIRLFRGTEARSYQNISEFGRSVTKAISGASLPLRKRTLKYFFKKKIGIIGV